MRNIASSWWKNLFASTLPNRRTRRANAARNRQRTAFVAEALQKRRVFTLPTVGVVVNEIGGQEGDLPGENLSIWFGIISDDPWYTTTEDVVVRYTLTGTAILGEDYTVRESWAATEHTVTIPAGWGSVGYGIDAIDDLLVEGTQTVIVTILPDPSYNIAPASPSGGPSTTMYIGDNDVVTQDADDTSITSTKNNTCTCPSCSCDSVNVKPSLSNGQVQANAKTKAGAELIYSGSSTTDGSFGFQIQVPEGMAEITGFKVGGQVGGVSGISLGDQYYGGSAEPRGKSHLVNYRIAPGSLATGRYEAEIDVTYTFADSTTATYTQTIEYFHVDASDSAFGAGWNSRGLTRLYAQTGGMFFDFGNGNSDFFRETIPGVFKADPSPHLSFSAGIVENVDGTFTYDDGHGNLQKFRADGYLLEAIDRDGNVTEYVYSDLNSDSVAESLTSIVDPAGRATTFEYASGRLWKITGIDGTVSTLGYDSSGRLTSIAEVDPDGGGPLTASGSTFTYDGTSDRLASVTDEEGRVVSYAYDANGYLSSVTESGPSSATTTTQYQMYLSSLIPGSGQGTFSNPLNYAVSSQRSTKKIDHDGKVTEYFFDRFGQANRIVHFDGTITESTFSADGLLLESIDLDPDGTGPLTDRVTTYTYDSNGNVTSITYADESTETFTYDLDFNELTSYTDQLGRVTLFELDATTGRLLSTTRVMGNVDDSINLETDDAVVSYTYTQSSGGVEGLIETITDAEGNVTKFVYDAYGRVEETIFAFGTADASSETFEYDTGDRVTAHEDGLGRRTEFVYDEIGRLIRTIHPDLNTSDAYGPVSTVYAYNDLGYLIAVTSPVSQNPSTGVVTNRTIQTLYEDGFHRVRTRRPDHEGDVDANPTDTVVQYDWLGRPVTSTDELGRVTTYQYDSLRRLQKVISPDPDGGGSQTASEITYGYNAWGWLVSETDALGKVTNYEYDAMGRVTKILRPELSPGVRAIEQFVYDDAGQLVASIDAMGKSTIYAYDDFGRLVSTTSPDPDGGGAQTASVVTFEYDENDNLVSETDALGHVTTYEYDAKNRLVKITEADPDGAGSQTSPETTFAYDDADQLLYTIDALGRRTDFEYDAWGRLVKTTLPDPDGAGPATRPYRQTAYDLAGRVISETDATGAVTSYEYDALDNVKKVTQADPDDGGSLASPVTNYVYDAAGQLLSKTDARGAVTTYAYDALGRVTSITEANPATGLTHVTNSPVTSYAYDKNGRLTSVTDALGGVTIYAYDAMGRKTSVTEPDPDGVGSQTAPVTAFTYDLAGRLLTETDPLGRVTLYAYDALGRVTSVTEPDPDGAGAQTSPITAFTYDKNGRILTETDALGRVTAYAYDNLGRLLTVTQPDPDGAGSLTSPITAYAYDAVGQRTSVTDPLNRTTTYAYNGLGQLVTVTQPDPDGAGGNAAPVTTYTYDAEGRVLSMLEPDGRNKLTQYEYDRLGRLIEKTDPDPDQAGTSVSSVTLYEYDATGNLTKVTDPLGNATIYAYDYLGRQTSVTAPDPDGAGTQVAAVTSYGYDKLGRRTSVTDPRSKTTNYKYDALGRLTEEKLPDPDGAGGNGRPTKTYAYDAVGNLVSLTDSEGNVHGYEYDNLDRLIVETDPLLDDTLYEYDAVGNVTKKTDHRGLVTEYQYDALNRRTAEIWKNGATVVNQIDYVYDAASQLSSVGDNWSDYAYTYDSLGRVVTVDNNGTAGVPRVILTNAYGTHLQRSSVSSTINGTADYTNTYQYDVIGRVTNVRQTSQVGGSAVQDKRVLFAYDEASQVTLIRRYESLATDHLVQNTQFEYDDAGRTSWLRHSLPSAVTVRYDWTYDTAGRVTSETNTKDGTVDYAYDETNQLTEADYSGSTPDEAYEYDENGNRVDTGVISTGTGNRLASDGTYNYLYDANGNRTRRTEIATGSYIAYTWDHRNRLIAAAEYNSSNVLLYKTTIAYDVFDRRISKDVDTDGNGTANFGYRYVYDAQSKTDANGHPVDDVVLIFHRNGTLLRRFLHGPAVDQILAEEIVNGTTEVHWTLSDKQGTVRDRMTYDHATLASRWSAHFVFDSFGNVVSEVDPVTGIAFNPATHARSLNHQSGPMFAFTGREWDSDVGLYYYRARWYDSATGQFVSEDPIFDDTANTYRYVGNGPTNRRDPSGLQEAVRQPGHGSANPGIHVPDVEFTYGGDGYAVPVRPGMPHLRPTEKGGPFVAVMKTPAEVDWLLYYNYITYETSSLLKAKLTTCDEAEYVVEAAILDHLKAAEEDLRYNTWSGWWHRNNKTYYPVLAPWEVSAREPGGITLDPTNPVFADRGDVAYLPGNLPGIWDVSINADEGHGWIGYVPHDPLQKPISIGRWPGSYTPGVDINLNPVSSGPLRKGLLLNHEVGKRALASRTFTLTNPRVVTSPLDGYSVPTNTCVTYAVEAWQEITGENLRVGGVYDPGALRWAIEGRNSSPQWLFYDTMIFGPEGRAHEAQ